MAHDIGNHFRVLEAIVKRGVADGLRPVYIANAAALYMFYGNALQMFVAVRGSTVLLVHLSAIGREHQEAEALARAIQRMTEYFAG